MVGELTRLGDGRYAAATFGCVGLGWLSGPMLGSTIWKLTHSKVLGAMEGKEKGQSSFRALRGRLADGAVIGIHRDRVGRGLASEFKAER